MVHTHPKQGGISIKGRDDDLCVSSFKLAPPFFMIIKKPVCSSIHLASTSTHLMLAGSNSWEIKDKFPIFILDGTMELAMGIIILDM